MRKLNIIGMGFFAFIALSFLFIASGNLSAQPKVESIKRHSPTSQYNYNNDLTWKVTFSEGMEEWSVDYWGDDFTLEILNGDYWYYIDYVEQYDKEGKEWLVHVYSEAYYEPSEIRLTLSDWAEFTTYNGETLYGWDWDREQSETYIYGVKPVPEVSFFSLIGSQNIYAKDVSWYIYFTQDIDAKTFTTADLALNKTGTATGTISAITAINGSVYKVDITNVSGIGNLRLDFTGSITNIDGDKNKNTYTYGPSFIIQPPHTITSITRYSPTVQSHRNSSVSYRVTFSRSMNAGTVSAADFQLAALSGQVTGAITSVSGSGTTFYVNVTGINKDVELRLDANGSFADSYNLTNTSTYNSGETYIIDLTAPVIRSANIESSNANIRKAIPENTVTVTFNTNEIINITSAKINGKVVSHKGSGSTGGSSEYTYNLFDPEGLATFEFTVVDVAGNTTTFNKTTDGSFVNFSIPIPQVVIIEQPHNVVACEGSIDKYLFVVAAPDLKGFNIAYRWWKDGRVISDWIPDFGQINFDTLRYKMSGIYRAELFVFDPRFDNSTNGGSSLPNGASYEEARVSSIVFSDEVNLYVLQKPSFLRDIKPVTAAVASNLSLTFEAQVYGEHNMTDPTYWTQIQWFRGTTPLTDNERYEGTKSSILNIENVQATDYASDYRVRLVGECDTVWSNSFAISEEPFATITTQPTSVEGCVGDVVQLSVEADATLLGATLTYQWLVDGVAIMDEVGKFNGANTPNLNVTLNLDLAYNGTEEFTCQVLPVGFPNNGVVSDAGMITWKSAPAITYDLSANYSAKENEKVELYITVTGDNLTYTWTKDGVDLNNNNDSLVIDMVAMADAGNYVATVSNSCGEVTSVTATLAVTPGPIVTSVNAQVGLGLTQNYPNPFDGNSTISFNSQRSGHATVVMTDMLGNVVANLYDGHANAGVVTPIQLNANNMNLNSGAYFITLRMGDKVETRQVSVVR